MSIKQELQSPSNWAAAALLLALTVFIVATEIFQVTMPFLSSPTWF